MFVFMTVRVRVVFRGRGREGGREKERAVFRMEVTVEMTISAQQRTVFKLLRPGSVK